MKDIAIENIVKVFNVESSSIKNLKRFNQGMSNYTFYFELNNKKYVIRVVGLKAYKFVDYENEYNVLKTINNTNITSNLIYYNIKTGTKVSEYIEGVTNSDTSENFVKTLKMLHNIKSNKIKEYNLINRLNEYESYNNKDHIDNNYYLIKKYFINNFESIYNKREKKLCHNDLQDINIIKNNLNEYYLIDFEYTAYNDPLYDIASYGNDPLLLFEKYYNKKPNKEDIRDILFYQMYQSLQWYQVALYKEEVGFSKLTNYNFKELANYFLTNATEIYNNIKEE